MEQILKSRYRIGEKISENPFSITYKGFFIGTDKPVIIKIYRRGTLNSSLIRQMKQKVKDFTLISHHAVCRIIDGDYGWQGFYYVREFIAGESVHDIMARGEKLGLERSLTIADQVLSALEVTHAKGIVHAALKPSNVFIDDQGMVKVTDFVIESVVKDAMPQKVLDLLDNAIYSSPEELAGREAGPASDIFSLGIMLYEMAAGKAFFSEQGLAGNLKKMRAAQLLGQEAVAALPRYLADILNKALQKDPLLRFGSVKEFREALERKALVQNPPSGAEFAKIFESSVTQYGGEEIDKESEALQDVGRIRLRWSKEKHRNLILAILVGASLAFSLLYAFFLGR